jgi:hypothetical protein
MVVDRCIEGSLVRNICFIHHPREIGGPYNNQ